VNTGQSPPGPEAERADREVATNRPRNNKNAARQLAEYADLRKIARLVAVRRCLPREDWQWLRWEAESRGIYGF
jgi:hypothetical protein